MFDATVHEASAPLRGSASAALDVARTALLAIGFEILSETDAEICARGPGIRSNREPGLLGASELRLHVDSSRVAVRATLGGVAKMKAFIYLFPTGLVLCLTIPFVLSGRNEWWEALAMAAPWLIFSPLMAIATERRTTRAVDALVRGMAGARVRAA